MRRRVKSFVTAAALVFATSSMTLLAGSGTANAAEPIIIGDCSVNVQGTPGQPISLAPAAVLGIITDVIRAIPLLGPPIAAEANKVIATLPPIPIGAVPNGTSYITGGTIANAVATELRKDPLGIGGLLADFIAGVQTQLTQVCGVTVTGTNAAVAPVQDGAAAVADASEEATAKVIPSLPGSTPGAPGGSPGSNPGTTPSTGGGTPAPNQPVTGGVSGLGLDLYQSGLWNFGRSPMADYSNIPFARPGMWAPSPGVRYGGGVPGYSPEFGIVGQTAPDDGVSVAGRAEAMSPSRGQRVEFPVLLAVLMLSGVTAALVRTWVLRRALPAAM
ncbi:hypothetical protein [Actinophytocola sp.]|uniref:hypothetical protein n=1 Tax=Actinophytocola sp. TaxID=1872138 RepID=UPI002ED67FD0